MISNKKIIKCFLILISIIFIISVLYSKNNITGKIYINEVNFQNNESNDWIELYNSSLNNKNLKGMYLSDDKKDFKKFKIKEDLIINSKGFLVLYGEDYSGDLINSDYLNNNILESSNLDINNLKLNFNIKNGEVIYLIDSNESVIDSFSILIDDVNSLESNVGRFRDGSENTFVLPDITPGSKNIKKPVSELRKDGKTNIY